MQLNVYCTKDIKGTLEKSLTVQTVAFPVMADIQIHPKVNHCR